MRLKKEWTAPASATTGMARYDLSDSQVPTKFSPKGAKRSDRTKTRKGRGLRSLIHGIKEAKTMITVPDYETMMGSLRKSVASILASSAQNKDELLSKSFDEFEEAMQQRLADDLESAFDDGRTGNIRKFIGLDENDPMQKGMSDVAELSMVLRQAEYAAQCLKMSAMSDAPSVSPMTVAAVHDWIAVGGQILKMLVSDTTGVVHGEPDGDEGEGNEFADDTPEGEAAAKAQAEKAAGMIVELKKAIDIVNAELAKADPNAGGDGASAGNGGGNGGGSGGDSQQMSPLEVIGRLAAGILVQVEAIQRAIDSEDNGAGDDNGKGADQGSDQGQDRNSNQNSDQNSDQGADQGSDNNSSQNNGNADQGSGGEGDGQDDEEKKKKFPFQKSDTPLIENKLAKGEEFIASDGTLYVGNDENQPVKVPAEQLRKREFTQAERDKDAKSGAAMKDGGFPIKSRQDVENAVHDYGRANDKEGVKKHIIERAKAIGASSALPADWASNAGSAEKADGASKTENTMTKQDSQKKDDELSLVKAQLAEMQKNSDALTKRIAELEGKPADAKAPVIREGGTKDDESALGKKDGEVSDEELAKRLNDMPEGERSLALMKMVHKKGGVRIA